MMAAYAQETRALRADLDAMRVRYETEIGRLNRQVERVSRSNGELHQLYYRAIDHIEFMEHHIRKTEPNWPSHTLPKELRSAE